MIIEKESKSGKYRSRFTRLSYEGENSTPYLEARGYLFPLALPHHGVKISIAYLKFKANIA